MNRLERSARRVAMEVASILKADVIVSLGDRVVASNTEAVGSRSTPSAVVPWANEAAMLHVAVFERDAPVAGHLAESVVALVIERDAIMESLSASNEVKERFLRDLLLSASSDHGEVQRVSRVLGLNLERPRSVLLVDASAYALNHAPARQAAPGQTEIDPQRVREVVAAIAWFFSLPDETICVHIYSGLIAVLKACATEDLLQWAEDESDDGSASWANLDALKRAASQLQNHLQRNLRDRIDVAVGRYHAGIDGLHASYEDCRLALKLGRVRGRGRMHSLDDLGLPALIAAADDGTKRSLAARLIGPLMHEPDMLPTLRAFFAAECSSNTAAQALAVHRNTLSYRLDKVASLTGLDPRRFNDAIQLRISLELCAEAAADAVPAWASAF